MITNLIKEAIETVGDTGGVIGNDININTLIGQVESGDVIGRIAAGASILTGMADTAHTIIDKSPKGKWAKGIGVLGGVAGAVLAYKDVQSMRDTYVKSGEINLGNALSFAGNALAVAAGSAMFFNPAGAAVIGALTLNKPQNHHTPPCSKTTHLNHQSSNLVLKT
ncbi:Uncharacterised protein [Moraxella lacunata]|uniref:Uncharacterized protein n=1 Tax=Moraxella lacunata TaxID=477 RepID=A0A378QFJ9_MORLA|nr:hypothetical protein [Moraxella lacunata]STY99461.1 Uncharacterised protein [Moraxella lacunata]